MQQAFDAKLARNKASGMAAFTTGEYKPYEGVFPEKMGEQFVLMLMLDDGSKADIAEQVVNPIRSLADKYAIPATFAGHGDLPSHVTLDVGNFSGMTPDEITASREWLASSSSHMEQLSRIASGLTFTMNELVLAPNSYICAGTFDDEQGAPFKIRKIAEEIMARAPKSESTGTITPPYPYNDIFHSSIFRLTGHAGPEKLTAFAEETYATVGQELRENPVTITATGIRRGKPIDYYREETPQWVRE